MPPTTTTALWLWLALLLLTPFTASALYIQTLSVLRSFPHDPAAFTEGLCFAPASAFSSISSAAAPLLLESTGMWGASSLRLTDLHTGRPRRELQLTQGEFGEGIAAVSSEGGDRVLQLTYQNGTAYEYQISALLNSSDGFHTAAAVSQVAAYTYPSFVKEGWGLASWPGTDLLYMSDGTSSIHVLHAANFSYIRSYTIQLPGAPRRPLAAEAFAGPSPLSFNELELLSPELLLANLYPTRCLALVNLTSSQLLSVIQADDSMYSSHFPALKVMNGIAYRPGNDSTDDMLLVTGKLWPLMYQVQIQERSRLGYQGVTGSEEEQLREACPVPEWTAAQGEHAKVIVAALQRGRM